MDTGLAIGLSADPAGEARRAEELGFDIVACGEHVFFRQPAPNAFATLAAAAAVTSKVRLLTAVALLPLYPAALLAKLAVTVDRLSAGRFELGVGAGGEFPREFAACGVDLAERGARMDEGLAVVRALLAGGPVEFHGKFCDLDGLELAPSPVRAEGVPLWIGGRSLAAQRRAGRNAAGWLPYMVTPAMVAAGREAMRRSAGDGEPPRVGLYAWCCVDADHDRARAIGTAHVSAAYGQDATRFAERYFLLGGPEGVVRQLDEFAAAGVSTVVVSIAANGDDRERVLETLAADVLPRLRST